jgi:A-kinase anchor protein 9
MAEDFERVIEDNLCLKKSLQVARHHNDKLQTELSDLRLQQQELQDANSHLHHQHNQLQKKYQLQMAHHTKDINTLTSQIEELKNLIEQKQMELEHFQIKIIPNLDQDMIRVKLITEMEGPYQEAVDKKDREIARLKQKLTEAERKANLVELQLETKQKELKRELADARKFHEIENEKIMKELNLALNRKEVRSYDKETFKVQRKELEELRCTLELQSQNEAELRKQVMGLKVEKEKLLIQMAQLNEKKALEMHLSSENTEIRAMKQEKKKMEEDLQRKDDEIDKLDKKLKQTERHQNDIEEEFKRANNKNKEQWEAERDELREEARREKEELRKVANARDRLEDELEIVTQRLKATDREVANKKDECEKLKATISDLEKSLKEYEFAKKQKLTLSKNLREESLERPRRKEYTE